MTHMNHEKDPLLSHSHSTSRFFFPRFPYYWLLHNPIKPTFVISLYNDIANLRYPAKNDKFFAGERRYSHEYQKNTKRLVRIKVSKIDLQCGTPQL